MMSPETLTTTVFLGLLAAATALQAWLARRQMHHVARHRDAVPAAFADRVTPAAHRKAADYTLARTRLGLVELAAGALVLLAWTLGGGLAALDAAWQSAGWGPVATGTAVLVSVLLVSSLVDLPFSAYHTFRIEQRFGFNRTTPGLFIADLLKQLVLMLVLAVPLAALVLWLMAAGGALWWLYVWAVWMGFSLLMVWAYPVLIAPLFNRFQPLEDEALRARIQRLLERCGFDVSGLYVMDGSRRSGHGNAYFTGMGRQRRIVFFDTLLEHLEPDEVTAVLAHELGHFRLHHVRKRMAALAALSLGGLALLGWLIEAPWFYHGLGVPEPSTHAGLILFMLLAPTVGVFLQPLVNRVSRRHEFEADAYAREHADAADLGRALVKLYRENASTLTPDPLYSAFHDTHPPAPIRLARLGTPS